MRPNRRGVVTTLTLKEIREIRDFIRQGFDVPTLAEVYGVSKDVIYGYTRNTREHYEIEKNNYMLEEERRKQAKGM